MNEKYSFHISPLSLSSPSLSPPLFLSLPSIFFLSLIPPIPLSLSLSLSFYITLSLSLSHFFSVYDLSLHVCLLFLLSISLPPSLFSLSLSYLHYPPPPLHSITPLYFLVLRDPPKLTPVTLCTPLISLTLIITPGLLPKEHERNIILIISTKDLSFSCSP